MPKGRRSVAVGVAPGATEERKKPDLVDLETFKQRQEHAGSHHGRIALAKPFPLPSLQCDVLVAPMSGRGNLYDQLFDPQNGIFRGEVGADNVDRELLKKIVLDCVVYPVLDEAAVDKHIEDHPAEFTALATFCMMVTSVGTAEKIGFRLADLDTEAMELFFAGLRGPGSTSTPA